MGNETNIDVRFVLRPFEFVSEREMRDQFQPLSIEFINVIPERDFRYLPARPHLIFLHKGMHFRSWICSRLFHLIKNIVFLWKIASIINNPLLSICLSVETLMENSLCGKICYKC